jgi:hypothetical protein
MNQLIIYTQDNGTVAIIQPTEEALSTMTIAQIAAKDVPAGVPFQIVDASTIPSDRTFRNAWKGDLTVDMPKAVEITKDRLRAERAPLLEAQDVAFQRAMETGDSTAAIVAEKNRLRDVTKLADRPGITLEQLKALKP